MFDDLFDFSKKRTPKQAAGFLLVHSGLLLTTFAILSGLGLA